MVRLPASRFPLLLVLICLLASVAAGENFSGSVISVEEGTLLRIARDGGSTLVRLAGIEAPSPLQPHGDQVRTFTSNLALGQQVTVEFQGSANASPLLGTVTLPDRRVLNQELVRNGFAWWNRAQAPNDPELSQLEAQAKSQGLGIWGAFGHAVPAEPEERPAPPPGDPTLLLVLLLIIVLLIAALVVLALQIRRLAARSGGPAPAPAVDTPSCAVAQNAPTGEEAEAIEARRRAIQDLLANLSEFVGGLVEQQSNYHHKMEGHKSQIQKAMTMAGLEEITRLLVREIGEMQATGEHYRSQLDQANARIAEQQQALENLQAEARLDFLTMIANRRAFAQRLGEEFARARRYEKVFSLVIFDIDHFKSVNDIYGHVAGDKMLQLVAMVIDKQIRSTDLVGRLGGEEFGVLLTETTARQGRIAAEKIRRAIEASVLKYEKAMLKVTVSAGVGEYASEDETPEPLIKRADTALYRAKAQGRNRVEVAAEETVG